jgi:hypothetical protein
VSERNGSTSWVHVVGPKPDDLGVGFDDGGEGLVELPDGDVFFLQAGLLEELLDDRRGRDGKIDGVCDVSDCIARRKGSTYQRQHQRM